MSTWPNDVMTAPTKLTIIPIIGISKTFEEAESALLGFGQEQKKSVVDAVSYAIA